MRSFRPDPPVAWVPMAEMIRVRGAREHNLRDVDLELPRDRLIVFTGISGSGKSSLAFDTIYAEGQRRYVESLSAYARQFLGQMDKPDVDFIEGLSPAISIDQKSASRNPRSTVGTITEIYDYLRLLYARIGDPALPELRPGHHPPDAPADRRPGARAARRHALPGARAGGAGPQGRVRRPAQGARRARASRGCASTVSSTSSPISSAAPTTRASPATSSTPSRWSSTAWCGKAGIERRLTDSLETALRLAEGVAEVEIVPARGRGRASRDAHVLASTSRAATAGCRSTSSRRGTSRSTRRTARASAATGSAPASRSTPSWWCPTTTWPSPTARSRRGAGSAAATSTGSSSRSPRSTASTRTRRGRSWARRRARWCCTAPARRRCRSGTATGTGASGRTSPASRVSCPGWSAATPRPRATAPASRSRATCGRCRVPRAAARACGPRRSRSPSAGATSSRSARCRSASCAEFFGSLELSERDRMIADAVSKEVNERLRFLLDVGLDYLNLNRASGTLAGGEAQRIRLASQIGSGLVGVLYVLDEPSIGLHQRDNERLIDTLVRLRDLGQHRHRRRARRGDHPGRRLHRRHRTRARGSTAARSWSRAR